MTITAERKTELVKIHARQDGDTGSPEVQVSIEGKPPVPMRARVMTEAERAEHWPGIAARHPHYAGYQKLTTRVIPLVVLEPR